MSRQVIAVRVPSLTPHPNADTLDVGMVWGTTPIIVKRGIFQPGQLVALWEPDTIHPALGRVKAKRLRGVWSLGMIEPLPEGVWEAGQDVTEAVGAKVRDTDPSDPFEPKYTIASDGENCPHVFPKYTDIEDLRKNWRRVRHGVPLTITEKLHGTSARYMHDGTRLWVASRRVILKEREGNLYWDVAKREGLAEKLAAFPPFTVIYGEIVGPGVQRKFDYGLSTPTFFLYDAWYPAKGFLCPITEHFAFNLQRVPLLDACNRSITFEELEELADEPSKFFHGDHSCLREGIVVRTESPQREIWKLVSRQYLEQKGK